MGGSLGGGGGGGGGKGYVASLSNYWGPGPPAPPPVPLPPFLRLCVSWQQIYIGTKVMHGQIYILCYNLETLYSTHGKISEY